MTSATTIDVPVVTVEPAKAAARDGRGRFGPGNRMGPGRKPGAFAKLYEVARKWSSPEKLIEQLDNLRALALAGNVEAAKVLLSKMLPDRLILQHEGRVDHAHAHVHYALPKGVVPIEEPMQLEALAEFAEVIN